MPSAALSPGTTAGLGERNLLTQMATVWKAAPVPEEVLINATTGYVEWRSFGTRPGIHLTLVDVTRAVAVIHSRGYSVGSKPNRIYVPARYHVFLVLSRDPYGVHRLEHLISHPVGLQLRGPTGGFPVPWRPYPGPDAAPRNGNKPG
jgi:hypothetical protein